MLVNRYKIGTFNSNTEYIFVQKDGILFTYLKSSYYPRFIKRKLTFSSLFETEMIYIP